MAFDSFEASNYCGAQFSCRDKLCFLPYFLFILQGAHTATETLKNSTYQFWLCQDSNPWPQDCETKALPLSYLSFDRNFDFWYWGHMASLTVLDFRFCHIFVNFCHQKRALDSDSVHPGPSHLYLSKISTICDQFITVPAANRCN